MATDESNSACSMEYSEEIAWEIHDRLLEGQSLRTISDDPAMPDKASLSNWLAQHPDFRDIVKSGREARAFLLIDEIEIVDDRKRDSVKKVMPNGKVMWVFDPNSIALSELRVEVRQWVAAQLAPGKYHLG
jgi:hypothetical protein